MPVAQCDKFPGIPTHGAAEPRCIKRGLEVLRLPPRLRTEGSMRALRDDLLMIFSRGDRWARKALGAISKPCATLCGSVPLCDNFLLRRHNFSDVV